MGGGAKTSPGISNPRLLDEATSLLSDDNMKLASFFVDDDASQGPQHMADPAMGAASNNICPPVPVNDMSVGMASLNPTTAASNRRGSDDMMPQLTEWNEQDLIWHPQSSFLEDGTAMHSLPPNSAANKKINEAEPAAILSENRPGSQDPFQGAGESTEGHHSVAPSKNVNSDVEYAVTCQRGKLKTLLSHLMDAAMSEGAMLVAEEHPVTVTLKLKV
ncbi:hypothetical protein BKA67DRAFT_574066 [Truncatella angustata]|uniref:Uncharacterized protein n=1 Tax=Truncatella angustata TaxID=152316 RepID=A0A9P8ZVC3_9PEZI|nr:uncharacterized protein BKA67DRAFT_574066 [Truncatella angustata]KAH6652469.1 hypothetical protein BKA67DRAFT_574066 [Truncatella angustata]